MNTNTKHRMIGTTDDVTTCERCGKAELRGTVILEMLDTDGNSEGVTYYGSTCAARALADRGIRTTAAKIRERAAAAQRDREQRATYAAQSLAAYGIAAEGDYDLRAAGNLFVARNAVCVRNNPRMDVLASTRDMIDGWRALVAGVAA